MKNLTVLLALVLGVGLTANAQLAMLDAPDQAAETELLLLDSDKEKDYIYNPFKPASPNLLNQMDDMSWTPLNDEPIDGLITCSWGDGVGGSITCPRGAVGCAVFANDNRAAISCVAADGLSVGGLHLHRNR